MTSGMAENIIHTGGVSKVYRVYDRPVDRFWELLFRRRRHREFKALSGIGFDVKRGESLAIIGQNGAGKSTLLKILAGIVRPSAGEVAVHGRVASILELGSSFHPEMTGRQNIVLNGAMLGLTQERLHERLPEIVAFSELGDFIDQPVKCYSTGMAMRLGFAIATQVDPDILIIDEALAVGDGYFQKKCMDRLVEMHAEGTTFLFCSHAMYFVTALCSRALWLRRGEMAAYGPSHEVVREYEAFLLSKSDGDSAEEAADGAASSRAGEPDEPSSVGPALLRRISLRDCAELPAVYHPGEPLVVDVEWESLDPKLEFHLGIGVNRSDGVVVCFLSTVKAGLPRLQGKRHYSASLCVPSLPLTKGEFSVHVFLGDQEGLHIYDQRLLEGAFKIGGEGYTPGLVEMDHQWQVGDAEPLSEADAHRQLAAAAGAELPS